jgi:UDP-N-acetyl-D-mannosaminuronic acid transferase (WecB/TagA/CpsF family)
MLTEKIMEKKKSTKKTQKKKHSPKERIAAIEDIKLRGLYLHGYAITADAAPIVFDSAEYQQLVDQFYEENKDLITPVMHRACRENYEFFMTIVEKALNQFRELEQGN